MIGVLGGMGPAATVDFLAKLIRLTPAECDQDHVPLVVVSDPRVPDRVAPIMEEGRGPSPLDALCRGIRTLEHAGADCIAIPCHTAHFWYEQMAETARVPILHIADAVLVDLARLGADGPVGLLATAATLKAGFYQERLGAAGYACAVPAAEVMATWVLPAIALVKRDRAVDATPLLVRAVEHLLDQGARTVLLACTELPLAMAAGSNTSVCLDATEALARACIAWHRGHGRA